MTPEQEAMLKATNDSVRSIEQLLKGYNGTEGMCAEFERVKKSFYAFRLAVIVSGALLFGGSGFGFAKLLEMVKG